MFFFRSKPKPVIVTIHGFGKRLHHEFDPLADYFRQRKYEVIQFDIYDVDNAQDADPDVWIKRCTQQMKKVCAQHDNVVLIGFSMGGVIASYLATIFPVKRLILAAPAFQYLDTRKIVEYGVKAVNKWRKSEPETPEKPSPEQTNAFTSIVSQYKDSIENVYCPVLMIHGTDDEVIPPASSRNAYKKIPGKKLLLFIEGGHHRMLYDHTLQDEIFPILELMTEGKLIA
ncbi:alpha/beta hydrolase [Catenisphaera adipataccumulans]|jgi:esterase/lipase|uniref:Esterase/lipase n=1 Tax=Catenisphaera adipataccumulans TaxID=700500 RepID=A0A7W8CVV1_9FIRM|nr:alpha/beta fold hydrolase [Catenisphaera adipataccumulans]MBB5182266.1 esterase/lipase [Catenisphaera adipataccumulans]